jgi:signal transduction histidine kinase
VAGAVLPRYEVGSDRGATGSFPRRIRGCPRAAYRWFVRRNPALPARAFDALVVAVAVATEVEILVTDVTGPTVVLVPAGLLYTLPLLLRRRFPFLAPVFAFTVHVLSSFVDVQGGNREQVGVLAFLLALWVVGAHNPRQSAVAGLGIAMASIVVITVEDPRVVPDDAANVALVGFFVWLAAAVLRHRADRLAAAERHAARLEEEQEDRAREAIAEERARIARELHDVVAHSVSVMTVQAGAARLLLPGNPDRAIGPLLAVEETGRQALTELRRLLGILRADGNAHVLTPQPGIEELPALAETVREAGLPVELTIEGVPQPLTAGVGLAAYRIVQEALTNTLKHAGPAHARVVVHYARDAVQLEVSDDGRGLGADSRGHGLIGMRERATVYGGQLHAGQRPGGGYVVRASLPIEAQP